MSIGDELAKHVATEQLPPVRSRRKAAPKGWEPGVVWNGDSGQIITDPVPADELLTHERLLVDAGFDPATYEIVGDLQWREWDAAIGDGQVQRFRYWKANLRQKIAAGPDVADLIRLVRRHRPRRPPGRTAQSTLVVPLADWQIGKADGDGTAGSVDRVLRTVDSISAEIRRLKPTRLLVAGMGDLVEGCTGFYPAQEWQTELNRRDQEKLVREMLTKQLTTWAKLVDEVLVVCVGGNHGENRLGNGRTTDAADNADVAVFEQVAAILAANPDAYSHVGFVIPADELAVVLDVEGHNVAFTHGHMFGKGASAKARGASWWKGQMFGKRPAGEAELLVSAHFHTFSVTEDGPRTHIACPTLDGGSKWFADQFGVESRAGQLSFLVTPDGWDHLRIH